MLRVSHRVRRAHVGETPSGRDDSAARYVSSVTTPSPSREDIDMASTIIDSRVTSLEVHP